MTDANLLTMFETFMMFVKELKTRVAELEKARDDQADRDREYLEATVESAPVRETVAEAMKANEPTFSTPSHIVLRDYVEAIGAVKIVEIVREYFGVRV